MSKYTNPHRDDNTLRQNWDGSCLHDGNSDFSRILTAACLSPEISLIRRLSIETYTSTKRSCSGQNRSNFGGATNREKNEQHNGTFALYLRKAVIFLQAIAVFFNRRISLMGCVMATGAQDGSRRQPKTTYGVILSTRN